MSISKTSATIIAVRDLSATAREVTLQLRNPMHCIAGSFINLFMDINGISVRRAYSVVSFDATGTTITLAIRLTLDGAMTPRFWDTDIIGRTVDIMGPLGLNTANKMHNSKIYLFGFGIGAGVIKSLAEHFSTQESVEQIIILTGNRSRDEILYRDYFDTLAHRHPKLSITYVISQPSSQHSYASGYIQDHISNYDFSNSDIYICGAEIACNALSETIKKDSPVNCNFFIEGFH